MLYSVSISCLADWRVFLCAYIMNKILIFSVLTENGDQAADWGNCKYQAARSRGESKFGLISTSLTKFFGLSSLVRDGYCGTLSRPLSLSLPCPLMLVPCAWEAVLGSGFWYNAWVPLLTTDNFMHDHGCVGFWAIGLGCGRGHCLWSCLLFSFVSKDRCLPFLLEGEKIITKVSLHLDLQKKLMQKEIFWGCFKNKLTLLFAYTMIYIINYI